MNDGWVRLKNAGYRTRLYRLTLERRQIEQLAFLPNDPWLAIQNKLMSCFEAGIALPVERPAPPINHPGGCGPMTANGWPNCMAFPGFAISRHRVAKRRWRTPAGWFVRG